MARPLRVEFAGALYRVTARGNARQDIVAGDTDRTRFVHSLGRIVERRRWRCSGLCLMTNHDHLLVETPARSRSSRPASPRSEPPSSRLAPDAHLAALASRYEVKF